MHNIVTLLARKLGEGEKQVKGGSKNIFIFILGNKSKQTERRIYC